MRYVISQPCPNLNGGLVKQDPVHSTLAVQTSCSFPGQYTKPTHFPQRSCLWMSCKLSYLGILLTAKWKTKWNGKCHIYSRHELNIQISLRSTKTTIMAATTYSDTTFSNSNGCTKFKYLILVSMPIIKVKCCRWSFLVSKLSIKRNAFRWFQTSKFPLDIEL